MGNKILDHHWRLSILAASLDLAEISTVCEMPYTICGSCLTAHSLRVGFETLGFLSYTPATGPLLRCLFQESQSYGSARPILARTKSNHQQGETN
jgi:hypothetical protein